MKKGGVKTSGVITLIMYFLLLVIAVFGVLSNFLEPVKKILVDVAILGQIVTLISAIFVYFPLTLIMQLSSTLDADLINTLNLVLSIVFAVFCLFMFFWGIKEIALGKKDDYRFAKCKKTCAFMHFIKFMVFAYLVAVIVCTFLVEGVKNTSDAFSEMFGVPYIFVIVTGVLAFLQFLCFVLAVANINKVAKAVKQGQVANDPNANYQQNGYNQNAGYNNVPQGQVYQGQQMQANMPPMNNYQPQYNQPQQPQTYSQPQQMAGGDSPLIVPGQNGIPVNITQKGIQDLERLERLRQSGAITESNYIIMRTKICNSNLS